MITETNQQEGSLRAMSASECEAAQHRQQLIELLTLLLVPIDHLEGLVAFEQRRQLESPNPMLLGARLCREQASAGLGQLARLSAPALLKAAHQSAACAAAPAGHAGLTARAPPPRALRAPAGAGRHPWQE